MRNNSFECLRSVNNQLHNKLSQEVEYTRYLKRIDNIVDRPVVKDTSPDFYMTFLHKCKNVAKDHHTAEESSKIVLENKHLLNKILKNRTRKFEVSSQSYHLAMHEKRNREIEKINAENKKIASRITEQYSTLRKTLGNSRVQESLPKQTLKKTTYATWNYSPIKPRKLPKLIRVEKEGRDS